MLLLYHLHERYIVIIKKRENVDLCACKYKDDDPTDNLFNILIVTTPMNVEVGKIDGSSLMMMTKLKDISRLI